MIKVKYFKGRKREKKKCKIKESEKLSRDMDIYFATINKRKFGRNNFLLLSTVRSPAPYLRPRNIRAPVFPGQSAGSQPRPHLAVLSRVFGLLVLSPGLCREPNKYFVYGRRH